MCAPRKLLPILAVAGLAVATGGLSVGATTAAATTTSTVAPFAAGQAGALASQTSSLTALSNALKIGLKYANTAAPVIGAGGLVYSGQIQKSILEQQANFSAFQSAQEEETYALRKDQRRRRLAIALGKQRALYGITGVRLEETPTDILTQTARSFAEDDFYDRYGTSGRMLSSSLSASNLRRSGEQAELGGLLSAELTLAQRGIV
ncbi:hypothetical protein [Candidatus Pelagibacter sp.]|uniref:hypothetical protein n=1 Tax=Candidatus Pelagibacter sp. TaxID=2024849 RepID=UPI003F855C0F